MNVIYAKEKIEFKGLKSIYLVSLGKSYDLILEALEKKKYSGFVLIPENRNKSKSSYFEYAEWEKEGLKVSDGILFWVDRDLKNNFGFEINVVFGEWYKSGKIILGAPKGAFEVKYLRYLAVRENVPVLNTIDDTVDSVLKLIGVSNEVKDVKNVSLALRGVEKNELGEFFAILKGEDIYRVGKFSLDELLNYKRFKEEVLSQTGLVYVNKRVEESSMSGRAWRELVQELLGVSFFNIGR